ncbi:MAG: glycosyltransferase family 4 protein [Bacteroidetes bacterium]|nr:glycosyltransferase family 4 protein [Bacteroidota bacterium]
MKVLFIFGGLPHYYNAILNRLNNVPNLEISVVVPSEKSATIGAGVHQSDKGINFKIHRLEEYSTLLKKPFFKGISAKIKEISPDAIVVGWPYIIFFWCNPFLRNLLKRSNIKLICKEIPFNIPKYDDILAGKEISYFEENSSFKVVKNKTQVKLLGFLYKGYFNLADAHVNYVDSAFEILGSYGVPKEKIFITYNSIDTDVLLKEIGNAEPNPIKKTVLHVGRLVKWKKVDLLIRAHAELVKKHTDAELRIIGDGPEMSALKVLAAELKISENVNFLGKIYDAELGKYFLSSSVYVLAGMGGLSINEAMCYSLPVVVSECDGTEKKLLRDGFNGKYFITDDQKDLANQIDFVISDDQRNVEMGKNSLSIVKNEINVNTVIQGYLDAFNYVSQNKNKLEVE